MMDKLIVFVIRTLFDLLAIALGAVLAFILYALWLHFVGY